MNKVVWASLAAALVFACDDGGDSEGGGGAGGGAADFMITDAAPMDAGADDGGPGDATADAAPDAASMVPSVDERCPEAQAGTYLLVLFPDRVDAYRQQQFGASYLCPFIPLAAHGITNATGMARGADGNFYVVQTEDERGRVYAFDPNGDLIGRVESNINLGGVAGIWNTFGDDFVVWSQASQNFYRLSAEGRFMGSWSPPTWQGSRVEAVTDVLFLSQDSVLMTFSDRPAQLFKHPFAPTFPPDEVGPGNAVLGVLTEEGTKVLMTAQIGGAGNGYGVVLYKPADSGRVPPELERILVAASEITDGVDLLALDTGLMVLDSALGGSARITTYNLEGELQQEIAVQGGGDPIELLRTQIFPDF